MRYVLVLAGASGVGKTSIAMDILSEHPEFTLIRSATTRAPRGDGRDSEYIYLSEQDFLKMIESRELLEYMRYGDNYYGTPLSELDSAFKNGKIPLLILDLMGVKSLREKKLDFSPFIVYIYEDINVIERRLYERDLLKNPGIEALEGFMKRKLANMKDYSMLPKIAEHFDAFVKNSDVSLAKNEIMMLFSEFKNGGKKDSELNKKTAESLAASIKK